MEENSLAGSLAETLAIFEDSGEPWTTPEVADCLDVGRRTVYTRLEKLVEYGELETKKVGANARVWWRPRSNRHGDGLDGTATGESGQITEWAQQFRLLVEATEEYGIFMLDPDGYVKTWNPGAERIKGYDADEILDTHFSMFYTENDRESGVPEENLETAAETGSVQDEGWRLRKDGTRFWAVVTITALRDDDGTLAGFAKVTRDMTERQEHEQQLREEKTFVESLLDTQQDILYAFDTEGEFLRWNDRFQEVTGYTDAEIEQMHPTDFIADRATPETMTAIEQVLEHGNRRTVELPLVTADGDEIPYELTGGPLMNEDGIVIGLSGIGRDISERKAKERQLERQRDELESELDEILERISDGFYALDNDFQVTYLNDHAEELLELEESSVLGQDIRESVEFTDQFEAALHEAVEREESVRLEDYFEPLDGWFENTIYPSDSGLSVYFRDITERRERERALEQYEALAETASDTILVIDEESQIQRVNPAVEEMFGYTPAELLGKSLTTLMPDRLVGDHRAGITRYFQTGERALDWDHVELPGVTADGTEIPLSISFSEYERDDQRYFTGIIRDVTDRKEREQELRDRISQQEVVTELGTQALEGQDLDALMAEATEQVAATLDNDYCKVLDLDAANDELLLRQGVGWDEGIVGEATVSAVEANSQASYTLASEQPVIVEDLRSESRFAGPELLRNHDVRGGISVVIGPTDNPWGILGTHDTNTTEFSEQDATFVQAVANVLAGAIERHDHEQQLVYQREQLAALNSLNSVIRDITAAVIEQSTREEIEETVCERLAESDSYLFAWTGDVDMATQTVNLRTEAGVEGYLDEMIISVDPDDERSQDPTARALRTGEVDVVNDIHDSSRQDLWRAHVEKYGFRSSAAIPIVHEDTIYGVLNVYAERTNAFAGQERTIIAQLGEIVGHAIAAAERKQALMSDELVELEFRIDDMVGNVGAPLDTAGKITFDHTVAVGDGEFLVYGTATPEAMDSVTRLVEALPHWERVTVRSEGELTNFELRLTDPPVLSVLASLGGYVDSAVLEEGDYRMTVHLAPTVDVRQVIDAVTEAYPNSEVVRRQQITRVHDNPQPLREQLVTELTDRQRTVLEAAYHAGFFEWPRNADGQEVAESLGIAPPTFHQHLRKAEQKVLDSVFASLRQGAGSRAEKTG